MIDIFMCHNQEYKSSNLTFQLLPSMIPAASVHYRGLRLSLERLFTRKEDETTREI
jgi:hypothetical protein